MEGLGKRELLSMLQFGADRVFTQSQGRAMTDVELDEILDRTVHPPGESASDADPSGSDAGPAAGLAGAPDSEMNGVEPRPSASDGPAAACCARDHGHAAPPGAHAHGANAASEAANGHVDGLAAPSLAALVSREAGAAGTSGLQAQRLTAADFDAETVPLSTFVLGGTDYSGELGTCCGRCDILALHSG